MILDGFLQTFSGKSVISLLKSMAVANGNQPLDGSMMTEAEAKRHLVSYDASNLLTFNNWSSLADEVYNGIKNCGHDEYQVKRYVYRLHMQLKTVAPYFYGAANISTNQKSINEYFRCIIVAMCKARRFLESIGYCDNLVLDKFNHKWDKPCFHATARIGVALERLGNVIQGCLYENGIKHHIFDYEKKCGIFLVKDITPATLAYSMDWTIELAESYMASVGIGAKRILPLDTIPELQRAISEGWIDSKGFLQCSNRDFVRYCYGNYMFLPMNKNDWHRIDMLLTSRAGKVLSSDILSQIAQQLRKEGLIEDEVRFGKRIFRK